jgi:hypothetical protein
VDMSRTVFEGQCSPWRSPYRCLGGDVGQLEVDSSAAKDDQTHWPGAKIKESFLSLVFLSRWLLLCFCLLHFYQFDPLPFISYTLLVPFVSFVSYFFETFLLIF